jgi:hypothetical protein
MPWRVITPAGYIYVEYASDCLEYKKNYWYAYGKNPDYKGGSNG